MAKEISFSRVASKLKSLHSTHISDNTIRLWQEFFKSLNEEFKNSEDKRGLTASEVKRLFRVFSDEENYLAGGRQLSWTDRANPDNWTAKWVESLFDQYHITTVFGPTVDDNGNMIHPRKVREAVVVEDVDPIEARIAAIDAKKSKLLAKLAELDTARNTLQEFINARNQLKLICETAELSQEALEMLIARVKNGI